MSTSSARRPRRTSARSICATTSSSCTIRSPCSWSGPAGRARAGYGGATSISRLPPRTPGSSCGPGSSATTRRCSAPQFARALPIDQVLISPSIDPLADKNRDLDAASVTAVVKGLGIDPSRPLVTQVSRFDRLKDPLGVIDAYRLVRRYNDCQLLLVGGAATDDPEGSRVLAECRERAGSDPDVHVVELPPTANLEINALQRASTVIVQKSLR